MGKTFRTAASTQKIDFTIEGGDGEDYEEFSEHFVCRGSIPAGIILEFGELSSITDGGVNVSMQDGAKLLSVVKKFFAAALSRKDRERFQDLIDDPDRPVDINSLMEIMNWLSGEFSARPTGEPSLTSSPVSPTGVASTAGLLPLGTTFSRPETRAEASA